MAGHILHRRLTDSRLKQMATQETNAQLCFDYGEYGCKDGKSIYNGLRSAETNRRHLVLKAAKELRGHADNTAEYLRGLEQGMRMAGATQATARRLRYEVAAVIASYNLTMNSGMPRLV